MKNSLKQIFRTPLKTGLFCIIFIFGTILFSVGLNLWLEISEKIKTADEAFVTIGMVRQKEQSTMMTHWWDAGLKDYIYQETKAYGDFLAPEVLKSLDIEYISSPQQRPYFGAGSADILTGGENTDESLTGVSLVEIRALKDCVPEEPVSVEVVRVLWGTMSLLGKNIDFCDHRTKQPMSLEAGKTYITYIGLNPLNAEKHEGFTGLLEYMPLQVYENQRQLWYEVTDGFYETEEGTRWENIAGVLKACHEKMVPVTPVSDLQLLRPFHDGDAVLVEGREIDQSEYGSGAKVCLVPQGFANLNGFQVGDSFPVQFYFAEYKNPLCQAAFEDGGYETFASKMRNTRIVAGVLFFAGLALLSATIAFLMYFLILKQRRRTAVERALGMTKRQCIVSLLGGIMVLTAICGTAVAAVGMKMNRVVQEAADTGEDGFSIAYTKGLLEEGAKEEISLEGSNGNMWTMACLVVVCETGLVWILALF